MADEITTNATPATVTEATVTAPKEKKKRAPKGSKTVAPAAAVAVPAKTSKPRVARAGAVEPAVSVKSPVTKSPVKSAPAKTAPKPAVKASKVSVAKVDDFADLIQLEAENKKLRVALAAKLRAENADLRKRLETK